MKKTILLLLVLTFPILIFAQIQWQNNGVPVRTAENIHWQGTSCTLTDGSVVSVWQDSRDDSFQIYGQRIDSDGNKLWGDGINISDCIYIISEPKIEASSDGSVFVSWYYCSYDYQDYWLSIQKISPQGDLLWTSTGVTWVLDGYYSDFEITSNATGGVLISWKCLSIIKSKMLNNDGSVANGWNEEGNVILNSYYTINDFESAYIDDCFLFSYIISNGDFNDVYVQKADLFGNILWGVYGILIQSDEEYKTNLQIIKSENSYWICWNCSIHNITIYKFDSIGNSSWNLPLIIDPVNTIYSNVIYNVDINENLYVCWYQYEAEEIRIAKIDSDKNLLWGDFGIVAYEFNDDNCYQTFDIVINDNEFVSFICNNYIQDGALWYDQFDPQGNSVLTEPIEISSSNQISANPCISLHTNDQVLVEWCDYDFGNDKIKYQILENNTPQLAVGGEVVFAGNSGQVRDVQQVFANEQLAVSWRNWSNGDVYLQYLDSSGSASFQDGLNITNCGDDSIDEFTLCYNEITQTVNFAWENEPKVFVQSIDSQGNILWNPSGVSVSSSTEEQNRCHIDAKDDNLIVGWTQYNGDFIDPVIEVYANKIDSNGNLLWGDEGVQLSNASYDDYLYDVNGNFFIWLNAWWPTNTIYATLLDENGNTAAGWEEFGKIICEEVIYNSEPCSIELPDGYVIVWVDENQDEFKICGQYITFDGEELWDSNGKILADINYANDEELDLFFDDAIYVCWHAWDGSDSIERIQKFDLNGNPLWPNDGLTLESNYYSEIIKIDNNFLLTFGDSYNNLNYNIKTKLYNQSGEELWQINVCDQVHDQHFPVVNSDENNNVYISWYDNRAGLYNPSYGDPEYTAIYSQKIYIEPTPVEEHEIPNSSLQISNLSNFPNPFNPSTTISFNVTQSSAFATIEIYNLKGQKVRTLPVNPSTDQPINSVTWNGTDDNNKPVSSGIYFYKLKAGKLEKTKKMLMIK